MWPFKRVKKHLRYDSVSAWIVGENVPDGYALHPDPVERDKYITQYAELRQQLFDNHIKALPIQERALFEQGSHPSQSHEFSLDAQPYTEMLRLHLRHLGCNVIEVRVGLYHEGRIVLSVALAGSDAAKSHSLPWLFSGFEVKYALDSGSQNLCCDEPA